MCWFHDLILKLNSTSTVLLYSPPYYKVKEEIPAELDNIFAKRDLELQRKWGFIVEKSSVQVNNTARYNLLCS